MSITDGQILEVVLCLLDESSRPNILFGAPAIATALLEKRLDTPSGSISARQVIRAVEPLLETLFIPPRRAIEKQLKRNGKIEEWVVFEAVGDPPQPKLQRKSPNQITISSQSTSNTVGKVEEGLQIKWTPAVNPRNWQGQAQRHGFTSSNDPKVDDLNVGQLDEPISKPSKHIEVDIKNGNNLRLKTSSHEFNSTPRVTYSEGRGKGCPSNAIGPAGFPENSKETLKTLQVQIKREKPSLLRSFSLRSRSRPSSPIKTPETDSIPELPRMLITPKTPKTFDDPHNDNSSNITATLTESPRTPPPPPIPIQPRSANRPVPLDLPLPPLRRSTSHSPPSAPLPPITLRLDPNLPGGEYEPTLISAVGQGEKERKRNFLQGLIKRKKDHTIPPIADVPPLPLTTSPRFLPSDNEQSKSSILKKVETRETLPRMRSKTQPKVDGLHVPLKRPSGDPPQTKLNQEITGQPTGRHTGKEVPSDIRQTVQAVLEDLKHPQDPNDLAYEVNRLKTSLNRTGVKPNLQVRVPTFRLPANTEKRRILSADRSGIDMTNRSLPSTSTIVHDHGNVEVEGNVDGDNSSADVEDGERSPLSDAKDESIVSTPTTSSSLISPLTTLTPVPTTFLGKTFEGLPFGPDVPAVVFVEWITERWQVIIAELVIVLGLAYVVQASGL